MVNLEGVGSFAGRDDSHQGVVFGSGRQAKLRLEYLRPLPVWIGEEIGEPVEDRGLSAHGAVFASQNLPAWTGSFGEIALDVGQGDFLLCGLDEYQNENSVCRDSVEDALTAVAESFEELRR